jgi:hypothetical protein
VHSTIEQGLHMSVTYTKLFSSLPESTIWCEPSDTRVLWITMMAMADSCGRVFGSVPGLAKRANISVESCRIGMDCLLSPDPDSRSKTDEGRRITVIDGGWRLVNYDKYREIKDNEARKKYNRDRMRASRAKSKA